MIPDLRGADLDDFHACQRLWLAVLLQCVRDVAAGDRQALAWLLSDGAQQVVEAAGINLCPLWLAHKATTRQLGKTGALRW